MKHVMSCLGKGEAWITLGVVREEIMCQAVIEKRLLFLSKLAQDTRIARIDPFLYEWCGTLDVHNLKGFLVVLQLLSKSLPVIEGVSTSNIGP
jgi:hypothetical protein